ncbi:MAG: hypothetical protein ACRDM0_02655 [Thermoleophilaceae bacterium]
MTITRSRRIVRLALVAVSVAALLAPAVQANHQDGDARADAAPTSATATQAEPTAVDRLVAQETARRSDRRVTVLGSQALPETLPAAGASGFDWRDAGIGAGFASAVALLGASAALVIRQRGGMAALRR